jgi:4,5-dihydroxyphthalate decarboxylase
MIKSYPKNGPVTLEVNLQSWPVCVPLKTGKVKSDLVTLNFVGPEQAHHGFKAMVRDDKYDVGELAIATYLMAKTFDKPIVLVPAVVMARFQLQCFLVNAKAGIGKPKDIEGKRIAVRSYSVTTGMWVRGMLQHEFGLDPNKVTWLTGEEPHVGEYRNPPNVEEIPPGSKSIDQMVIDGDVPGGILAGPMPEEPRVRSLLPDPDAASMAWVKSNGTTPVNHLFVVRKELSDTRPDVVRELYRMLAESKKLAGPPKGGIDFELFGVEANRKALALASQYAFEQKMIPRQYGVDELFDDTTRAFKSPPSRRAPLGARRHSKSAVEPRPRLVDDALREGGFRHARRDRHHHLDAQRQVRRERGENLAQRQRALPRHPAFAGPDPLRQREVGLARRQHAVGHLSERKEFRIDFCQVGRGVLRADQVERIDQDDRILAPRIVPQLERALQRVEHAGRHEFQRRREAERRRRLAEAREVVHHPAPLRIVALHDQIFGAEFRAQRDGRHERRDVRVRQHVEAHDVEHGESVVGDHALHVADERRVADHGVDRQVRRFLKAQADAVVAGLRRRREKRQRRRFHQRGGSEDQFVHSLPPDGALSGNLFNACSSMIPKSGNRFSDKIMLEQRDNRGV